MSCCLPWPLLALVALIRLPFDYARRQLTHLLLSIIATGPVPRHIAFEMDGNRRYARSLGKEGKQGHGDGFRTLLRVLELCLRLRIHSVTVYAFAIDNFNRPKEEVDALMEMAETRLVEIAEKGHLLDRYGVRLNVLGKRSLLPPKVQVAIEKAEYMTRHNNAAVLNVCAPYSSKHEITTAVESAVREALENRDLDGSTITEGTIEAQLSTSLVGSPPLDVFVRTSGVKRLSSFLTWQCNENTQIHMVDTYWPDFGLRDFIPVLLQYQCKVWREQGASRSM